MRLPINEIFISVDGEVNDLGPGKLTVFIRTQGCNLNCHYCDTKHSISMKGGKEIEVDDIVKRVISTGIRKVTITGGEPLLHRNEVISLVHELRQANILVSIETNGTQQIPYEFMLDEGVCIVADLKSPMSAFIHNIIEAVREDKNKIWVKFLVAKPSDFIHSCQAATSIRKEGDFYFVLSPVHGEVGPRVLLDWIINHIYIYPILGEAVINTQIHKYIFPEGEKSYILY